MIKILIKYLLFKPVHKLECLISGRRKENQFKPSRVKWLSTLAYKLAIASMK